jgi:hypothetical protein
MVARPIQWCHHHGSSAVKDIRQIVFP